LAVPARGPGAGSLSAAAESDASSPRQQWPPAARWAGPSRHRDVAFLAVMSLPLLRRSPWRFTAGSLFCSRAVPSRLRRRRRWFYSTAPYGRTAPAPPFLPERLFPRR